jgi:hypothetical protein
MSTLNKITEHMLKHTVELYNWEIVYTVPDDRLFRSKDGTIGSIYYNTHRELYAIQYEGGNSRYNVTGDEELDIEAFQLLPISM